MADSLNDAPERPIAPSAPRLYSPGTIAAYTIIANIPVGLILYGLNLRVRAQRGLGNLMLVFAGLLSIATIALSMNALPTFYAALPGILAGLYLYGMEKSPFYRAIQEGAVRARWWPPALWVLAVMILLAVVESFTMP
jgi:hypothetical protein